MAQLYSSYKAEKHQEESLKKERLAADRWSALQNRETQRTQQQAAAEVSRKVQTVTAEVYGQNIKEKTPGLMSILKSKYEEITLSIERSKAKKAEKEARKNQELGSFYGGVSKTLSSLLNNWGEAQRGTLLNAKTVSEQASRAYQESFENQQLSQQRLNAV